MTVAVTALVVVWAALFSDAAASDPGGACGLLAAEAMTNAADRIGLACRRPLIDSATGEAVAGASVVTQLTAWGGDTIRVQIAVGAVNADAPGAILPTPPPAAEGPATVHLSAAAASTPALTNGNLRADVDPATGDVSFRRVSDGDRLLFTQSTTSLSAPDPYTGLLPDVAIALTIDQSDDTPEMVFGMGEHEDGLLNRKGTAIDFEQCEQYHISHGGPFRSVGEGESGAPRLPPRAPFCAALIRPLRLCLCLCLCCAVLCCRSGVYSLFPVRSALFILLECPRLWQCVVRAVDCHHTQRSRRLSDRLFGIDEQTGLTRAVRRYAQPLRRCRRASA
jgi:hypothetical protein